MDKRNIAKFAMNVVAQTTIGSAITKTMIKNAPKTADYHVAEVTGAVAGYVIAEQLRPATDKLVDDWFDKRAAKKLAK